MITRCPFLDRIAALNCTLLQVNIVSGCLLHSCNAGKSADSPDCVIRVHQSGVCSSFCSASSSFCCASSSFCSMLRAAVLVKSTVKGTP